MAEPTASAGSSRASSPSTVGTPDASANASRPENDATATPEANNSAKNVTKDRPCPYCQQFFTSSSLGRHLDQFITKKKPDGIHNVAEIRAMRGRITRRQPRNSSAKRESIGAEGSVDSPGSAPPSSKRAKTTPFDSQTPKGPGVAKFVAERPGVMFNSIPWEATGVMDLSQGGTGSQSHFGTVIMGNGSRAVAFPSGKSSNAQPNIVTTPVSMAIPIDSIGDLGAKAVDSTERVHFKAVELALKELLNNVKAASLPSTSRPSPFDFDFQAQTFPSLCLQLLPTPPTLFSTHVLPSPDTYNLDPPGQPQLERLQQQVRTHVNLWRQQHQPGSQDESDKLQMAAFQHEEMAQRHVELAMNQWMRLSEEQRRNDWQLELMRALARQSSKREEAETQLARTQQENNSLKVQLHQLSRLQFPREFMLAPPSTSFISRETMKDIQRGIKVGTPNKDASAGEEWDFDQIVGKWKRIVQNDQARRYPSLNSPLPTTSDGQDARPETAQSPAVFSPVSRAGPSEQEPAPPKRRRAPNAKPKGQASEAQAKEQSNGTYDAAAKSGKKRLDDLDVDRMDTSADAEADEDEGVATLAS